MAWPVLPHGFLGTQGGDEDTYQIERSLRFNSADTTYLSRTPSVAGNRKTWTLSFWYKKSSATNSQILHVGTSVNDRVAFNINDANAITITTTVASVTTNWLLSNQVLRDHSAWSHFVVAFDTTQATASNRLRAYVNGVEVTSWATDNRSSITQNSDHFVNATNIHYLLANHTPTVSGNGYIAEAYLIDGQALTPSSFGETDAITGRWKAKSYGGTYGTNGFYLKFADNSGTTSTTLGKDSSGNGNNWTPNNFSVTAGAGNDSLVDSPTNYGTDTGLGGEVRGNYATLNPLSTLSTVTIANGALDYSSTTSSQTAIATIGVSSGKWYWEVVTTAGTTETQVGVYGTSASTLFSLAANSTIYGIRFNADTGALDRTSDGSTWTSIATGLTSGPYFPYFNNNGTTAKTVSINFGQRPFAYTAPSGFKALCTQNLPQPTIQKPSTAMDVVTYTGTGASQSISSLGFSPDLVWIKGRSGATDHTLYDIIRGSQARLESNTTDAEVTSDNGLTSFDSAGFTIGTLAQVNTNTATYVGWSWDADSTNSTNTSGSITSTVRANPQAGFSIVSYTGSGTNGSTIGHGLGVAPKMIIVKRRTGTENWYVGHSSIGWSNQLILNSTLGAGASGIWFSTQPTSSVFYVGGTGNSINESGQTAIAYCFAEIEGYSKFGSYTGNGLADGPFVWCGFRPRWVMIKRTDVSNDWQIWDTQRNTFNIMTQTLTANLSDAEVTRTTTDIIDSISSGIKIRASNLAVNASGGTYIFAAFAEAPFKYARAR